jgi:hypothetical protein
MPPLAWITNSRCSLSQIAPIGKFNSAVGLLSIECLFQPAIIDNIFSAISNVGHFFGGKKNGYYDGLNSPMFSLPAVNIPYFTG